jgi:hypothetical protein
VRDPFTKPISLQGECTPEDLRAGLLQMYICYCPTQLMQVPKLITKFKSVGKQALTETQKRFNQMPFPGEVYNVLRTCPRTRLCVYYAFYAPEKINSVDDILSKYRGYNDDLWRVLIEKYGPEKPPQRLFENWEEMETNQKLRDVGDQSRFRSPSGVNDLDRTNVFSTDHIEGKPLMWHRDPEQQVRELGRNSLDSTSDLGSRHASFAMFSPASFVYPQPVVKRAASIMLREDESFDGTLDNFGPMLSSPRSEQSPHSPKTNRLDLSEIDMILAAAKLDTADLCPIGGRTGADPPPLPEELSPLSPGPPALPNASMFSSNASFLSPRALRRRQTQVSFVNPGLASPHHSIEPGMSPPSALARQDVIGRQDVLLPPALAAKPASQEVPKSVLADDFDKL